MPFLDHDRRFARQQRRQARRRRIADFVARTAGLFTGAMFGTSGLGWLVTLALIAVATWFFLHS